jgi:catalase (peroxidase I)
LSAAGPSTATASIGLGAGELAARARGGLAPGQERVLTPPAQAGRAVPAPPTPQLGRALKAATAAAAAADDDDDGDDSDKPGFAVPVDAASIYTVPRPPAPAINMEEADASLPDAALVAKILSKNATTAKQVLGRLGDLEWHKLAAEAVVESGMDVAGHAAAKAAEAQALLSGNKTVAAEAVARALIEKLATPNQWGLLLRAAFHDAGAGPGGTAATAPAADEPLVGGLDGSLRFELHWGSNAGVVGVWPVLALAKKVLDAKYGEGAFSWADVIAVGGAAGVKAAGGPVMTVGLGRRDAAGPDVRSGPATDPGHAKDFSAPQLLAAFSAFGVDAHDTVALMGAHTLGLAMLTDGSEGPLGPPKFTNFFYRAALAQKASFIVDNALGADPATLPLMLTFARDQATFFSAFTDAYTRMTWWGH